MKILGITSAWLIILACCPVLGHAEHELCSDVAGISEVCHEHHEDCALCAAVQIDFVLSLHLKQDSSSYMSIICDDSDVSECIEEGIRPALWREVHDRFPSLRLLSSIRLLI